MKYHKIAQLNFSENWLSRKVIKNRRIFTKDKSLILEFPKTQMNLKIKCKKNRF